MKPLTRRSFLAKTTAAAGLAALGTKSNAMLAPQNRQHPLDGIEPEKLRITDITVTPLSYADPSGDLWRSGNYIVWKTDAVLCRVYTDQGLIGIGEGTPYSGPEAMKKHTEEVFRPMLVGKNSFDAIRMRPAEMGRMESASWAGVDNALWDIIGKVKNQPVYKLLSVDGNPQPRIHMYASGGDYHEWYNNGADTLITEAIRYKALGFDAFKFRNGTQWQTAGMNLKKYIPIMERLREAVGPDFKLMHERMPGTGVTFDEIINEFCPMLDELRFHWFEQPWGPWSPTGGIEDYLKIIDTLKYVKVSGGEAHSNSEQMREWIERGALEIVQSDCNETGLTENWIISRMADKYGRPHCPHSWHGGLTTMVNAHLVAAIPNRHMLEINMTFNPLKEAIFKDPLVVKNGWMELPDKPGYGVELIDDVEKKFPWVPGSYNKPNPRTPT
jgi:L-alanine-DL-glutamate epimerase-like enolase superfamily enzyme